LAPWEKGKPSVSRVAPVATCQHYPFYLSPTPKTATSGWLFSFSMPNNTQPTKPVLTPATIEDAILRLARATDAELAEWDRRLPAELRRWYAERARQAA
jgi:hypothetical protein